MFVDCPRELVVELPRHQREQHRAQGNNTRRRDQARVEVDPRAGVDGPDPFQLLDCRLNLVHFDGRIDHHAHVVDAYPNHLNRVLQPQRIPDEHQLV